MDYVRLQNVLMEYLKLTFNYYKAMNINEHVDVKGAMSF